MILMFAYCDFKYNLNIPYSRRVDVIANLAESIARTYDL